MYCSACATPIEAGQTVCSTCGNILSPGLAPPAPASPTPVFVTTQRPHSIVIATWLLAISVLVSVVGTASSWAIVGVARMASLYTAWLALIVLGLWAVTVLLTWTGNPAARILVMVGISWTLINLLMRLAVTISAVRGSVLGQLYWLTLGLRLVACYLLFRKDSTVWFKEPRGVPVNAPPA